MKIGHGNRIEMFNFMEEAKELVVKGGFDLQVEMKQLQIEKYGELVYSNFYEVYLIGDAQIIKEFLKTV